MNLCYWGLNYQGCKGLYTIIYKYLFLPNSVAACFHSNQCFNLLVRFEKEFKFSEKYNPLLSYVSAYSSSVQAVLALRHSVWGWHRERDGDSARRRRRRHISMVDTPWRCPDCGKCYIYQRGLNLHRRFECGKEPMFQCPHCPKKCHQPGNLTVHVRNKHGQNGKLEISLLSKNNQSDLHAEIKSDLVAN